MGRSLRSLEQSVSGRRIRPQRKMPEAEGSVLSPDQLQTQIDVIRGRRLEMPGRSLRQLEARILGRTEARVIRQSQRLDNGQVARPVAAAQALPWSLAASSPTVSTASPDPGALAYAPEFSAPDSGRFEVESFATLMPDDVFRADPALMPAAGDVSPRRDSVMAPANTAPVAISPANITAAPVRLADDDAGWMVAAQQAQPGAGIPSSAGKRALDPGLALARDEFERELAGILGAPSAPVTPTPVSDVTPPAPQNNVISEVQPVVAPVQRHDIFDQMGLAMRYANSFDLGNVDLNSRFRAIEQELETTPAAKTAPAPAQPYVDPMSLDEFDLVAELADISAERPSLRRDMAGSDTHTPTVINHDPQAGECHEQPTG